MEGRRRTFLKTLFTAPLLTTISLRGIAQEYAACASEDSLEFWDSLRILPIHITEVDLIKNELSWEYKNNNQSRIGTFALTKQTIVDDGSGKKKDLGFLSRNKNGIWWMVYHNVCKEVVIISRGVDRG